MPSFLVKIVITLFIILCSCLYLTSCKYNKIYTKEYERVVHTDSLIWHVKSTEDEIDIKNEDHLPVYYITGKNIGIVTSSLQKVKALNGSATLYTFDHKIIAQGSFSKGFKDDEWSYFGSNGNLIKQEEYKNGALQKIFISGDNPTIGQYKNNVKDGQWIMNGDTTVFKNGEIVIEKIEELSKDTLTKKEKRKIKRENRKKLKEQSSEKDKDKGKGNKSKNKDLKSEDE